MANRPAIGTQDDPLDRLLSTLATGHGRHVLHYFLASSDDVASLSALAGHACARGDGPTDRDRVAARLHHVDLPKLADAGVVDFDPRTGTVRYRGHPVVAAWARFAAADRRD